MVVLKTNSQEATIITKSCKKQTPWLSISVINAIVTSINLFQELRVDIIIHVFQYRAFLSYIWRGGGGGGATFHLVSSKLSRKLCTPSIKTPI